MVVFNKLSYIFEICVIMFFQELIKMIQFGNVNFVCYYFDEDVKDGNDFIIGLNIGDGESYLVLICFLDIK